MQLLRCQNENCSTDKHGRLIFDFQVEDHEPPVCPTCGTDMRERPEFIVRRKLMHYDPPHARLKGRGKNEAACGRTGWESDDRTGYTGDPGAVTCDRCKATEVWAANAVEMRVVEKFDLVTELDPTTMTIKKAAPCGGCP